MAVFVEFTATEVAFVGALVTEVCNLSVSVKTTAFYDKRLTAIHFLAVPVVARQASSFIFQSIQLARCKFRLVLEVTESALRA
jgi:hypothetical protein